jgi:transcription antitermination factor NusG
VKSKYEFSKGEAVRIKVGAFRAFIGKISEIDKGRGTLKVIVEVLGKIHSVELTFLDVEKLDHLHKMRVLSGGIRYRERS